ncbi:uncharacterized protein K460DRAFT_54515 [Cucurbitaria berberidis CBS 394.84]|uniref:Uncharacterized protein n=1 Tax=Cucurbitaria berberidis CBS 394.84 TaxID=1168544 RepID=A0A9P4GLB7_9PLEO|nr:uncharacterized protein K460DRAFT_54515 [Cucurbitaria berberidis CBS 394.84]KAF1847165.1 hypothetical protein K460DRAFT_54515 [Cucurbitaria berberidis CBS 394.84]
MRYILSFLCIFYTFSIATVIKRASDPCPYHRIDDSPGQPLIPDEYLVNLRDNYTIEQHFQFLGQNLSQTADIFHHMPILNIYHIRIDERFMHKIIRYDPGVESVSHNMVFAPELHWHSDDTKPYHSNARQKRWKTREAFLPWWED